MNRAAKIGLGAVGAAGVGYNLYRWRRAVKGEKKNPKFWFSRTRKAWNRSQARVADEAARQFSRLPPKGRSGQYTNREFAKEFARLSQKHRQKLKKLSA